MWVESDFFNTLSRNGYGGGSLTLLEKVHCKDASPNASLTLSGIGVCLPGIVPGSAARSLPETTCISSPRLSPRSSSRAANTSRRALSSGAVAWPVGRRIRRSWLPGQEPYRQVTSRETYVPIQGSLVRPSAENIRLPDHASRRQR